MGGVFHHGAVCSIQYFRPYVFEVGPEESQVGTGVGGVVVDGGHCVTTHDDGVRVDVCRVHVEGLLSGGVAQHAGFRFSGRIGHSGCEDEFHPEKCSQRGVCNSVATYQVQ